MGNQVAHQDGRNVLVHGYHFRHYSNLTYSVRYLIDGSGGMPYSRLMIKGIKFSSIPVSDQDRALAFYTEKLDFVLLEDTPQSETKRWVLVAPRGASECSLLLAKAASDEQTSRVGNQTGGRVFLFLETDDFWRDYESYKAKGVNFVREPKMEDYGTVAVFEDLYGNLWDLVEFKDD